MEATERTPLVTVANKARSLNWNRLVAFWAGVYQIYIFVFYQLDANPDGSYPYKGCNLFAVSSLFAVVCCWIVTRLNGSQDPFVRCSLRLIMRFFFPLFVFAIASMAQILAVGKCGATLVSIICYGRVISASIFQSIFNATIPDRVMVTNLIVIFLLLVMYVYMRSLESFDTVGVAYAFFAYLMFDFGNIGVGKVLAQLQQESHRTWTVWQLMFIQNLVSVPVYVMCIPIEQLVTGSFLAMDYVPGYNYSVYSWLLVVGIFLGVASQTLTAAWSITVYILSTYAGIFGTSITVLILDHFSSFDFLPFCCSLTIALASVGYVFSSDLNDANDVVSPLRSMLETRGVLNKQSVTRISQFLSGDSLMEILEEEDFLYDQKEA